MNQAVVRFFVIALGVVSAIWVGRGIGEGSYQLVTLLLLAAAFSLFSLCRGLRVEALCAGILVAGYMVGNRGFAQISLIPGLPLFPGEVGLALGGSMILLRMVLAKQASQSIGDKSSDHERTNTLNVLLLLWIGLCGVHLLVDFPKWGMVAFRDYALVYYALFYFIGYSIAEHGRSRSFLIRAFIVGSLGVAVVYPLFMAYEPYFVQYLQWRGIPVIYFKGDLAGIYGVMGGVLFYGLYRTRRNHVYLGAALLCLCLVPLTMSRAAMLGILVAALLFWCARERGWLLMVSGGGLAGLVALCIFFGVQNKPFRESPVYDFYEHVISLTDIAGTGEYRGESSSNVGDNNRFRLVWWRTVVEETLSEAPVLGLGFGYNLANPFIREYYPGMIETDFTARSPHNYLVTLLGRTGIVGLLAFGYMLWIIARQTRVLCEKSATGAALDQRLILQIMLWVIFTGALFGVVLEGPMGAVPFWLLLGLSQRSSEDDATTSER